MKNVTILGDGLLGSELKTQNPSWEVVSRKKDGFDVTNKKLFQSPILGVTNVIVNCVGCTDTYSQDRDKHWNTNVVGVKNLLDYCDKWGCKLVHISTDYIYANSVSNASEEDVPTPCNTWYGYSKLVGDALVQLDINKHLIIRGTHKPNPFPYEKAWLNQIGNFDYVDVIASQISQLIEKKCTGIFNVGTELKSMFNLAQQTNPQVIPTNLMPQEIPKNVSLSIDKFKTHTQK